MTSLKKIWPQTRDYLLIILGALIQAAGLRMFLVPANLASGGVSGISQLINHYTGWPIGVMVLIGNIPLFLLGWRFLGGHRFAVRTALAVVTFSLATDLLLYLPFFPQHGLTDDIVLNSLYGRSSAVPATDSCTGRAGLRAGPTFWRASSTTGAASR